MAFSSIGRTPDFHSVKLGSTPRLATKILFLFMKIYQVGESVELFGEEGIVTLFDDDGKEKFYVKFYREQNNRIPKILGHTSWYLLMHKNNLKCHCANYSDFPDFLSLEDLSVTIEFLLQKKLTMKIKKLF